MLTTSQNGVAPCRRSWHAEEDADPPSTLSKASTPTSLSSGIADPPSCDHDERKFDPIDPLKLSLYEHWANGCGCGQGVHFAPPNVEYRNSMDMKHVDRIRNIYNPPARLARTASAVDVDYEFDSWPSHNWQHPQTLSHTPCDHLGSRIRLCLLASSASRLVAVRLVGTCERPITRSRKFDECNAHRDASMANRHGLAARWIGTL